MIIVRMVQPALDQIVHMIAMRDRGMTTVWPVNVPWRMPLRPVSAGVRMCLVHGDHVLIHMPVVQVMEVAIVDVIRVAFVFNRHVSAPWTVLMSMVLMFNTFAHNQPFHWKHSGRAQHGKEQICKPLAQGAHSAWRTNITGILPISGRSVRGVWVPGQPSDRSGGSRRAATRLKL